MFLVRCCDNIFSQRQHPSQFIFLGIQIELGSASELGPDATMTRPSKPIRAALYARVSTDGQTAENQIAELVGVSERLGWTLAATYIDAGISGSKGREGRPAFNDLCRSITRGEVDLVAAWSVDRLGRSLQDLVGFLVELQSRNVGLYLHQQGLDTTTPAGRAMFQMLGVFAEFERAMIQARVHVGLARARQQGKRLGRPPVDDQTLDRVRAELAAGTGMLRTAKKIGCGVSVVQRVKAEMKSQAS